MPLRFEPIHLDRQTPYLEKLAACATIASDYSFVNLWGWADGYGLEWAWTSDLVWIRQTRPETRYWAPVGRWDRVNWRTAVQDHFNRPVRFERVPKDLLDCWQRQAGLQPAAEPARSHWDYLYAIADLVALSGRKYHKKKNLLHQFTKNYAYRYLSLRAENIDQTTRMQEDWCKWRDCAAQAALDSENRAILKILDNWNRLDRLVGGALLVDDRMVAYTVAEKFTDDTLLIHFEKGNTEYKGVYQAINRMFLQEAGQAYKTVNREQDLGNGGMRRAKVSYHPVGFVEKFNVTMAL